MPVPDSNRDALLGLRQGIGRIRAMIEDPYAGDSEMLALVHEELGKLLADPREEEPWMKDLPSEEGGQTYDIYG